MIEMDTLQGIADAFRKAIIDQPQLYKDKEWHTSLAEQFQVIRDTNTNIREMSVPPLFAAAHADWLAMADQLDMAIDDYSLAIETGSPEIALLVSGGDKKDAAAKFLSSGYIKALDVGN